MQPAFSSLREMLAFALLLVLLLAGPAAVAHTGWLQRKDVYPAIPWKNAPSPWIQEKIFTDTGDADVVFMGSSQILFGIDTPYVQREFSKQLGRDAKVFTLGWPWPGFDAVYTVARDLLNRRHVRMLVVHDIGGVDAPHYYSARWFRIGENSESLEGLPIDTQAALYGGAVLNLPRHLLSLIRPNLIEDPRLARDTFWDTYYRAPNTAEQLGAMRARIAWGISPDFVPYQAHGDVTPGDVIAYSPETRDQFSFGPDSHAYQMHFAQKLARLCQEHGTRLVILKMPEYGEHGKISLPGELSPAALGAPADVLGIPPDRLFSGVPTADVVKLYYDGRHFNQNGMEMFTPLVTPPLFKLYDAPIPH